MPGPAVARKGACSSRTVGATRKTGATSQPGGARRDRRLSSPIGSRLVEQGLGILEHPIEDAGAVVIGSAYRCGDKLGQPVDGRLHVLDEDAVAMVMFHTAPSDLAPRHEWLLFLPHGE